MGLAIRPPGDDLIREIKALRREVNALNRVPSGLNSIGIQFLRPAVKAGTPSDADYTTPPPVGTVVVDTTGSKLWVRTATSTWKSVGIA